MARLDDLKAALEDAYNAGNSEEVDTLATEIERMQSETVPDIPAQPVPGSTPQVPSPADPLLYPDAPVQTPEYTGAFNPDMAMESLSAIARGMGNAVSFGGTDVLRSKLNDQPLPEVQAESERLRSTLAPGVATGTEIAGSSLLPLEAVGPAAKAMTKGAGALKQAVTEPPEIIQGVLANIDRRAATESTSKAQIIREEVKKLAEAKGTGLSKDEVAKLNEIVTKGGPVRKTVEKLAQKKPTLGLDLSKPSNYMFPGSITSLAMTHSPDMMIPAAKAAMAARVGGGVAAKGVVGLAKGVDKMITNKDLEALRNLIGGR